MIIDDEINRLLVNPLMPNVRLHAVIDACHSGSAMDLEFRCKSKHGDIQWKMEYDHQPSVYKVNIRHRTCSISSKALGFCYSPNTKSQYAGHRWRRGDSVWRGARPADRG